VPNGDLEIRVQFAALIVALVRAGPDWFDALEALWEWGEEWLDINREELEEELGIDA
jgi:DNA-binding HxlR family transcriptional regulator